MEDTLLEVRDLQVEFSTKMGIVRVLDKVNLKVDPRQTVGIIGESGCGKSTLGRVILHLHERTEGRIVFQGEDISDVSNAKLKELRKDMQIIFQDPYASLNPRMSIGDIIAEPLKIYKLCNSKAEREKKVHEIMDVVGLAERTYSLYPPELDGGRRQRVGIARALILDPKLVVCDEPVSALDVSIQAQILNLMMELQKERNLTYLFITHNLSVVKHISDDIAVMYLGQVVEKAEYQELFARPLHPYSQALFSAIPVPSIHNRQKRIVLKGEITSPVNPKPCCRFAARCPYATDLCREREPELRDMGNTHFVKCHRVEELNK